MKRKGISDDEGPSRPTKRRAKATPTTPRKRKPKSTSPSPNKRLKGVEPMMYITQNEECTYKGEGTFNDDINWMTEKNPLNRQVVDGEIFDQGLTRSCWAWGTGRGTEAALCLAGQEVQHLAIQDILDRALPPGFKLGTPAAGLQFVKQHGVSEESEYPEYHGEQPNTYPLQRRPENLHTIDDWYPVDDDEDKMLEALQNNILIVSVLQFRAFQHLKGKCLLDMAEAEKRHVVDKKKPLIGHTLLLVGAGTFIPESELPPINYWIVKNQWNIFWGFEGLGYLIRNSSLKTLHSCLRKTRHMAGILKTEYLPLYAFVTGPGRDKPPTYVSKHTERNFSVEDLIRWIEIGEYQKKTLIYLFYDPRYCRDNNIDVDEEFNALEKTYHHTSSDVILAKVNLLEHETASAKFRLRNEEGPVLLVFLPDKCRSLEYGQKFEGNLNLGEILMWIGVELSAGLRPIRPREDANAIPERDS